MNRELVDKIVNAVLYEGYILYPYRATSKKNQRERFTFGRVYPRQYSDAQNQVERCMMQTECLVQNESHDATLDITVQFLQPSAREIRVNPHLHPLPQEEGEEDAKRLVREVDNWEVVPELNIDNQLYQTWQEAIEREITLPSISLNWPIKQSHDFKFEAVNNIDAIGDGSIGVIMRRNEMIRGRIEIQSRAVDQSTMKIAVRIVNETPIPEKNIEDQDEVIMRTLASTHTVLHSTGGKFVSLLDPDPQYADLAKACKNLGTWPVLVGHKEKGERDAMLSSPIILYDYPQIAAESAGDLFDSSEIDEILTLRVQTLTDEEKGEMRRVDEHARKILERTEAMTPEHFLKMHGMMREVGASREEFFNPSKRRQSAVVRGTMLKKGDRVRIHPKRRADIMDMALDGKIAVIESVEEDVENNVHFAVVLEDDPGRELGMQRYIGHRFFYSTDEVEPIIAG